MEGCALVAGIMLAAFFINLLFQAVFIPLLEPSDYPDKKARR